MVSNTSASYGRNVSGSPATSSASARQRWRTLLSRALLALLTAYVLSALVLMAAEACLLHLHDRDRPSTDSGRDLWLKTADGVRIYARRYERDPALPTLLYLHGGGGNVATRSDRLELFASLGANLLAVEYRGYGPSEGTSSARGLERDAQAAYEWLLQHTTAKRIVVFGESLGGGPAAWVASTRAVGGLILLSTFTTTDAWFGHFMPWLPTRWLVRTKFDNAEAIKRVRAPKLIIHSRSDEVVPFSMAQTLWDAAPEPKRRLWLDETGHNETFYRSRHKAASALREFLSQL